MLDYIAMEGWKGSSKLHQNQSRIDKEDSARDSEMDRYEAEYNFRHETNALLTTHGRQAPEDSLRRTDDKRKNAREAAAQKKAEEKNRRKDEMDRLKALKREEIANKVKKAEYLAGIKNADEKKMIERLEKELNTDFIPDLYDKAMDQAFDEGYYDKDDVISEGDDADDINLLNDRIDQVGQI